MEEKASSELGAAERLKAVERGYEKALEAASREHEAQLAAERTQLQADAARAVEEALAAHNAEVVDAVSQLKKKDAAHHAQLVELKAAHSRELLKRGKEFDEHAITLRKAVQKARLDKDREYASLAEQERLRAKETVRIAEQGLERKLESRKKELDEAIATASTTAEAAWAKRLRDAEAEHEQELHSLRQKNALQRGGDEKRAARDARAQVRSEVEAELAQARDEVGGQRDTGTARAPPDPKNGSYRGHRPLLFQRRGALVAGGRPAGPDSGAGARRRRRGAGAVPQGLHAAHVPTSVPQTALRRFYGPPAPQDEDGQEISSAGEKQQASDSLP